MRTAAAVLILAMLCGCATRRQTRTMVLVGGGIALVGGAIEAGLSAHASGDNNYLIPFAGPLIAPDPDGTWYPLAMSWGLIVAATQIVAVALFVYGATMDVSDPAGAPVITPGGFSF